jgi:hypothetical protein
MKKDRTAVMAVAILGAGLLVGGTSGAIATGQMDTGHVQSGAVMSPRTGSGTVTAGASAARVQGAKVIQYIADGALLDTQNSVVIRLPGTWNARKLAQSAWSVELIRNGPPSFMFALGQSAPAGESGNNGFYITVNTNGRANVQINAESYGVIDTIRVVRTVRTSANISTTVSRQVARTGGAGG